MTGIGTIDEMARPRPAARHIPRQPERVLDAPELLDDYCEWQADNR